MTEVTITVLDETINKDGRMVTVGVITDDLTINHILDATKSKPYTITKTFGLSATKKDMKNMFMDDIRSTINSARNTIKDNTLIGTVITVNI